MSIGLAALGFLVVAGEFSLPPRSGPESDLHVWKNYTNARFQYSVCYPEDILTPQGEPDNGDGQKFAASNGTQLVVFGWNNVLNQSLQFVMKETESRLAGKSGKITYEFMKANWFVVSGKTGTSIFYAKTIYSHNQFKSFELTYNDNDTATYEAVITRIAGCFRDLAR